MKIVRKSAGGEYPAMDYERPEGEYLREMWKRGDGLWVYDHDLGVPLISRRAGGGWMIEHDGFEGLVLPSRMVAVAVWRLSGLTY